MSKYSMLQDYLSGLGHPIWAASFSDIEKLINGDLPKSARQHRAWWANNPTGHSHSKAWVAAGWMTQDVNMEAGTLVFKKIQQDSVEPWGWLEGSVTILSDSDITKPIGTKWNAEQGDLHE